MEGLAALHALHVSLDMQKLYDFENRQEASAVEKALEEFGIIASIQEHEGTWSLSVPNSDEERARESEDSF